MGKKAKVLQQELEAVSAAAKKTERSLRQSLGQARGRIRCLEAKIQRQDNVINALRQDLYKQFARTDELRRAAIDCHLHLLTMTKNTDGAVRNYIGDACNILGRVLGKELSPYGWKPEDEAYTRAEVLRIVK